MMWCVLIVLCGLVASGSCQCDMERFRRDGLVPHVIGGELPRTTLFVSFSDQPIPCGAEVSVDVAAQAPDLAFEGEDDQLYTLLMIDPDFPSARNPLYSQVLYYLVQNIPGSDVGKGEVRASYITPTIPNNAGPHRYVFLVYRQTASPSQRDFQNNRFNFDVQQFARTEGLEGPPVAGAFFYRLISYNIVLYCATRGAIGIVAGQIKMTSSPLYF